MPVPVWRPPSTVAFTHDGHRLELIPLAPHHRQLLAEGFGRMSERSRYYRFMAPVQDLSDHELDHLTRLDMRDRFAWALLVDDEPAGVGRYARTTTRPSSAEVAVTVLDEFQGRGLGTLLISVLAPVAREHGFTTFEFEVLAENRAMLRILESLGADVSLDAGVAHGEVAVDAVPPPPVGADRLLDALESARQALAIERGA